MNSKQTFQLIFDSDYYQTGDTLSNITQDFKITSKPVKKYWHWLWRIPEFLSFGRRFNARCEYTVELCTKK